MQCVVCVLYTYSIQRVHNARRGPRPPDAVEMAYITLCINPYGNQCTRMQVQLGWSLKINLLRELHLAYNTAKYLKLHFSSISSYPNPPNLHSTWLHHTPTHYSQITPIQCNLAHWIQLMCQSFPRDNCGNSVACPLSQRKWWRMTDFMWVTMHYTDCVAQKSMVLCIMIYSLVDLLVPVESPDILAR